MIGGSGSNPLEGFPIRHSSKGEPEEGKKGNSPGTQGKPSKAKDVAKEVLKPDETAGHSVREKKALGGHKKTHVSREKHNLTHKVAEKSLAKEDISTGSTKDYLRAQTIYPKKSIQSPKGLHEAHSEADRLLPLKKPAAKKEEENPQKVYSKKPKGAEKEEGLSKAERGRSSEKPKAAKRFNPMRQSKDVYEDQYAVYAESDYSQSELKSINRGYTPLIFTPTEGYDQTVIPLVDLQQNKTDEGSDTPTEGYDQTAIPLVDLQQNKTDEAENVILHKELFDFFPDGNRDITVVDVPSSSEVPKGFVEIGYTRTPTFLSELNRGETVEGKTKDKVEKEEIPSKIKGGKTDSLTLTPIDYIRKKLDKGEISNLSTSGQRIVIRVPGKQNKYYVEVKETVGKGTYKVVTKAKKVNMEKETVRSGYVIGKPVPGKETASKKEFEHERLVSERLRNKIDPLVLRNNILVPEATMIKGERGANASKLVGNSLDKVVPNLTLKDKLGFAARFPKTLEIFHSAGITHRDIKPDNILLLINKDGSPQRDENGYLKFVIVDFGTCYIQDTKEGGDINLFRSEYMDPRSHTYEGIMALREANIPVDMDNYMLGLTLLNTFSGQTMKAFCSQVKKEMGPFADNVEFHRALANWKNNPEGWGFWKNLRKKLIKDCNGDVELAERIVNLIKASVNPDPNLRPSLTEMSEAFAQIHAELP